MNDLLQDVTRAIAIGLVEKTDKLLIEAINKRFDLQLEATAESLPVLKDRLHCIKVARTGVETYSLDGVPFFELHPIETRMDGYKLIAERKYRELK